MSSSAYIVDAWRTPFCRAGGLLAGVTPQALVVEALRPALTRLPALPGLADVLMGNVLNGRGNLARYGLLGAGFPVEIPGSTVDRQCASGMDAIAQAACRCERRKRPLSFVAGGIESMSQAPFLMARPSRAYDRSPPAFLDVPLSPPGIGDPSMIATAETIAREAGIDREAIDRYSLQSHARAIEAAEGGRLGREIVALSVPAPRAGEAVVAADNGPRADTTAGKLAALPAIVPGGTVTAGNASGIADGAACVAVMNESAVREAGVQPLARIVGVSCVGVDPLRMGLGPVYAIRTLLDESGAQVSRVAHWEINEAFAGQVLACARHLELDPHRINPDGGAIALGHPLGASGARIAGHLAHSLAQTGKSGALGVAALCVGGGMGMAMLLEAVC